MMQIIDGKGARLGRLASHVAKLAIKGEEIIVLNCGEVIITGSRKNIKKNFEEKRKKIGSGQQGPKHSRIAHLIVKRAIRGMLPNHRKGRGKQILKKIICYTDVPKKFEEKEKIRLDKKTETKFIKIKEITK